jgi:AbrB family looped-hinge helix DNA binding protein
MKGRAFKHSAPKFYGSVTVGERGQVVIPAEARRDFEIIPATKLLVFGSQGHGGLMFTKAETVSEFINMASGMIEKLEDLKRVLKEEEVRNGSN